MGQQSDHSSVTNKRRLQKQRPSAREQGCCLLLNVDPCDSKTNSFHENAFLLHDHSIAANFLLLKISNCMKYVSSCNVGIKL
jgi:hypothetical protein